MINIKNSIKEHYGIYDVPDVLLEKYNTLINSKRFSVDPVVIDMRESTSTVYNKIDYVLDDGSVVSIDESSRETMQNLFFDKYNVIEYMNECKENFFKVVQLII